VNYDLQQDGQYTVTLKSVVRTTGCECSKTKQVVMDRAAAKTVRFESLKVYPNPAIDKLWVRMSDQHGYSLYRVRNALGAEVCKGAVGAEAVLTVDLPGLSAGLYTLELSGITGQAESKFVVTENR